MKVAELMDDLETGDRSMEHLKSAPSPDGLTFSALQQAIGLLGNGSGLASTGSGIFSGLQSGNIYTAPIAQQSALNSYLNAVPLGVSPWK